MACGRFNANLHITLGLTFSSKLFNFWSVTVKWSFRQLWSIREGRVRRNEEEGEEIERLKEAKIETEVRKRGRNKQSVEKGKIEEERQKKGNVEKVKGTVMEG